MARDLGVNRESIRRWLNGSSPFGANHGAWRDLRTVLEGEPLRRSKLIGEGQSFMSSILPSGTRAVATSIAADTSAGGFILPNDKVDVILTKRDKNADRPGSADAINSETILTNIRVLAIDQTVGEKDGQKVVVGKTATLELKPDQAESLARARQAGTLSLALRSLVDANKNDVAVDESSKRDSVNVVRYGVPTTQTTRK